MARLRRSNPNCMARSLGSSSERANSLATSGSISPVKLNSGSRAHPTPSRLVTDFTNRPRVPGTRRPAWLANCSNSPRNRAKLSSCSGLEKLVAISCCNIRCSWERSTRTPGAGGASSTRRSVARAES